MNEGVGLLVYGMIGWLSIVTLAAVVVFVVVHVKLSHAASLLDDEEAFSVFAPKKKSSKKGSRTRSRPAPLSAGRRLPSMDPPGLKAAPSFLDYDYAVSALPAVEKKSARNAALGELNSGLNVSVISVTQGRINT